MIGRDGVTGLVSLAGSVTLFALAGRLPKPALVPIGPGFYPRILFAVTAVLSAWLVIQDLRAARAPRAAAPARYRLVYLTFLIFTGYVAGLPLLGFRLATFLFVAVLSATIEPPHGGRWLLVLALALATTLLCHWVFEGYLSVLLPRGTLTGF